VQWPRVGPIRDGERLIQYGERALDASNGMLLPRDMRTDRLQRGIELTDICYYDQEIADREHMRFDVAHAEIENGGGAKRGRQRKEGT
jgi:hypothetical protein